MKMAVVVIVVVVGLVELTRGDLFAFAVAVVKLRTTAAAAAAPVTASRKDLLKRGGRGAGRGGRA